MSATTRSLQQLPSEVQRQLEVIVVRFEEAWQSGRRPVIEDYLPLNEAERWPVLLELIHVDLERRLKAHEAVRIETYRTTYPQLADNPQVMLDLIATEFTLRRRTEPSLHPSEYLRRFPEYAADLENSLVTVAGVGPIPRPGLRYRPVRFHARGGLGEVFVAEDEELHREVALKRIQAPFADDPESRRRFLREAEVTGRLEHPGIVPVYGLEQGPDGQPGYAMRFIQGESLQEAIQKFHQADAFEGQRRLKLRELLSRFIAACNAVAYAHSRGTWHRDLKPANIMLGQFGETLVVDWGLAKRGMRDEGRGMREEGKHEAISANTEPPSDCSSLAPVLTQTGQTLGTPAYMSPEQAAGNGDQVGPASDIYSLGATLYCLLCGQAPFSPSNVEDTLAKVQRGDFPPPRGIQETVPRALEAVCLKAMALAPSGRYASALELAGEVERWLADEPVAVYAEPWRTRLGRWARRHRPLLAGTVALLLTAVAGLLVGLVAVRVEQVQTARERDLAKANLQRAEENLDLAKKAVDDCYILATENPLLQQESFRSIRDLLLEKALPYYQDFRAQRQDDDRIQAGLAWNLIRVGDITREIGREREALAAYEQAAGLLKALAAEQPDDPRYPIELAFIYNNLGLLKQKAGQRTAAGQFYEQARSLWSRLVAEHAQVADYRNALAATYNHLGLLQRETDTRAALASFEQAGSLWDQLVDEHPQVPAYQSRLATNCVNLGNLQRNTDREAAVKCYEQARVIQEQLVAEHAEVPTHLFDLGGIYLNLGDLARDTGQFQDALAWYAKVVAHLEGLRMPDDPKVQLVLRNAYLGRAASLSGLKQYTEAIAAWDRAITLDAGQDRDGLRFQRALTLARAGQHARAVAEAEALATVKNLSGAMLYDLARIWALAATAARQDGELAQRYAGRSLELLNRARDIGLFGDQESLDQIKKDPDLESLRHRADFQKLVSD